MKCAALLVGCCALVFGQASEYNSIYRGENGDVFSRQPNTFLVEMTKGRKPGRALDAGMGQGRNSIYLAKQGWEVTGFDSADEGIRQAKAEASRLGLRITALVDTFERFDFGTNRWDLIVLTYEPVKQFAAKVAQALRPGGLVVVEDRHIDTRRVWPAGTFGDNELLALFQGLRVLRYEDVWARPDWSARRIDQRLVRLAAERTLPRAAGCLWEGNVISRGGTVCWEHVKFRCDADGWKFTRERCTAGENTP